MESGEGASEAAVESASDEILRTTNAHLERATGLILAGRRGPQDAVADAAGASHRAFVEVGGTPMLVRVVRTLRRARSVGHIGVSIDDPAAVTGVPELRELVDRGELSVRTSLSSPSASVCDALDRLPETEALLVTTADHPLLRPEMVDHFAARSADDAADVVVGLVAATLLLEHFPESSRTFLRLRGERFSGANLFVFRGPRARRAAEFWRRVERFRKRPWRLAGAFGPGTLALFLLGRLDLDRAFERVSEAIGARIRPVPLPFAEAAIDVDKPEDLALVSRILEAG